ncbi:LGFP repeat-containing protein [Nocardia sp. X0981]
MACGATALLIGAGLLAPPAGEVYRMVAEAGPGHGRGLSQHGALHNARNGQNADQILEYYYPGAERGTVGPASVSVRLQARDGADLAVYAESGARVAGRVLQPGEAARLTPLADGGAHVVVTEGCDGAVLWETSVADPWVYPLDPNPARPADQHLTLCDGGAYRGSLGVAAENGEARTVNRVDIQDYLLGVVPAEMPAGWSAAALEAQAVASRSYALAEARWPYAQTCDTTDCQVYNGTEKEDPRTTAAVEATAGRVLLREGRILRAEYSAAPDGGSPADIQAFDVGPTLAELTVVTPGPGVPPPHPDITTGLPETTPAPSSPGIPLSPEGSKSRAPEGAVPGFGGSVPRTPEGSLPVPGVAPGETPSPIDTAYAEMGGARSVVGLPVTPEMPLPEDAGSYRLYENGVIVYTPELGTQVVDFTTLMQMVPGLDESAPGNVDPGMKADGVGPAEPGSTDGAGAAGTPAPIPGRMDAGRAVPSGGPRIRNADHPAAAPGAPKIPMRVEVVDLAPAG